MITFNNLFSLSEFEPVHLVAGKKGMNRPIADVNVVESDNLAEFFKDIFLTIIEKLKSDIR